LYDMDHIVSYSFDPALIGKKNTGGLGYLEALEGKATSKLLQKGSWIEILLGFSKENSLITFAPLRMEKPLAGLSGPIIGVVEVAQDLSEDYSAIFHFQVLVISTSTGVMGVLLLVLIFIVRRGEHIIEHRARERLKLKGKLSRAEHLSSLGEMVAVVSHEIRNPLGIIRSSAELLKKKVAVGNPSSTIPDIIVEEASRLNNIITDFLNFAKPKEPVIAPCRIDDIIEKNISFLSAEIHERNCKIETGFSDGNPEIFADANMMYQAFLNILINAMQAMPGGGIISVGIRYHDHIVSVSFDDNGKGVPEALLNKICDPFFTTKEKGTGLGLGIVKNIIEAHGGRIQIYNRSKGGTRILVELPQRQN